jgi:hypothetical protein
MKRGTKDKQTKHIRKKKEDEPHKERKETKTKRREMANRTEPSRDSGLKASSVKSNGGREGGRRKHRKK